MSLDVWRDVEERRKEKKAGPLISRIYFGFLVWGIISFRAVEVFWSNVFVSNKHHLLSLRIYSLQKASLRHFCQLKADFYVDSKGKILHNRLEFLKSRFTQTCSELLFDYSSIDTIVFRTETNNNCIHYSCDIFIYNLSLKFFHC